MARIAEIAARTPSRARILLIAAIAAAVVVLAPAGSTAQDPAALEAKIADAKAEAQRLSGAVDAATGRLESARAEAEEAAARQLEIEGVLDGARRRLDGLQAETDTARAELSRARGRLSAARDALAARLVAIYKAGTPDATELLLSADGFDQLATRAAYLKRIESTDASLAERVAGLAEQVGIRLDRVSTARDSAAEEEARIARSRDQAAAIAARAQATADTLAAARAERDAALDALRSRIDGWTDKVQKLYAVSRPEAQKIVGEWAIPVAIVMCESGGNYRALNPSSGAGGAYQILPSTWRAYGGKGLPNEAPPAEQDRIAAQIWADSGQSAWVCQG